MKPRSHRALYLTLFSFNSHLAPGLEALDVDAKVVVGVVGQGGVGVEDGGHGGRIQVARVRVHLQLQLGALWLPAMVMVRKMTVMTVMIGSMVDVFRLRCNRPVSGSFHVLRCNGVYDSDCSDDDASVHREDSGENYVYKVM